MPRTTDFPDARRGDAATVLVSPWLVPAAALQRAAADSVLAEWEQPEAPGRHARPHHLPEHRRQPRPQLRAVDG